MPPLKSFKYSYDGRQWYRWECCPVKNGTTCNLESRQTGYVDVGPSTRNVLGLYHHVRDLDNP